MFIEWSKYVMRVTWKCPFLYVVCQQQMTIPTAHVKYNPRKACYMCLETYQHLFRIHFCRKYIYDSCVILVSVHYLHKQYTLHNKTYGTSPLPLCLFCPGRDELFRHNDLALAMVLDICNLLNTPKQTSQHTTRSTETEQTFGWIIRRTTIWQKNTTKPY